MKYFKSAIVGTMAALAVIVVATLGLLLWPDPDIDRQLKSKIASGEMVATAYGREISILHVLQLRPRASDAPRDACDGSRHCGLRLVNRGNCRTAGRMKMAIVAPIFLVLSFGLYLAIATVLVRKYLQTRDVGFAWLAARG